MISTNIGRFFGPHHRPQGPQSFKFRLLPPIVHSEPLNFSLVTPPPHRSRFLLVTANFCY